MRSPLTLPRPPSPPPRAGLAKETGREIIVGGTSIMTAPDFLEQLTMTEPELSDRDRDGGGGGGGGGDGMGAGVGDLLDGF